MRDGPEEETVPVYEAKIREWNAASERGEKALMVIALKDTHELIGMSGYPWLPANAAGRAGNTGVMIDASHAKKGYGREAMSAMLDYGFDVLGFERIEQATHLVNTPYRALVRSLGLEKFEVQGKPNAQGTVWCLYEVSREEWQAAKAERAG
ncbi:acyl-CoA N-acyltransferase [Exidia glandulosa HHB12029]|uniref:Acyl-CoA N-acyltransferase n=1 Tax=Exidia glandulosa HHB12029 TaxID=1314781 RepID=A0A165BSM6_EXIGL|nr:acyl-CoA N-acyltransferase [Exidia glandulosa HHB12029]